MRQRRQRSSFVLAAVFGSAHALASAYWAAGGRWLIGTLGADLVARFDGRTWLLWCVALVKLAGALTPLALEARRWPHPRVWRTLVWAGAAVLVAWGAANTVVGNLVLAGVIRPEGGVDHGAMVGHALLWDPLFLAWGLSLAMGMSLSAGARGNTS